MKWVEPKPPMKILCVNYRAFLDDVCPNIKCSLPAVCCCCNENKACPQHPRQTEDENTNYCPQPDQKCNQQMEPCGPQEPVTVYVQPCSITYTEGNQHKCAPGAQKCFANQGENNEDCGEPIPTFSCAPCGGTNWIWYWNSNLPLISRLIYYDCLYEAVMMGFAHL